MNANRFSEQDNAVATMWPPSPNGQNGGVAGTAPSPNGKKPAAPNSRAAGQAPSPNGKNGPEPAPRAGAATGREANGQFAKGNFGGPGNPFARRVAELRQAVIDAIDKEKIRELFDKLYDMAISGDARAARLLLSYTLGKPEPVKNPDHMDTEEWQHFKETAPMMRELSCRYGPDARVPLTMVRIGREALTYDQGGVLGTYFSLPPDEHAKATKLLDRRDPKFLKEMRAKMRQSIPDPSTISVANGPPPSPNGKK